MDKPRTVQPAGFDRLPPHSSEAERGVLACIMLSPSECIDQAVEYFGTAGAEVFYELPHRVIYQVTCEMQSKGVVIDIITLQAKLNQGQQLDGIGGMEFLTTLPDAAPSAANLDHYLQIVWDKFLLRRIIAVSTDTVGLAYEEGDAEAMLADAEKRVMELGVIRRKKKMRTMKSLMHGAIETLESYQHHKGMLLGLGTGLVDLDKLTGGLIDGEMTVLAARPSVGKTSLSMNIAESVICDQGFAVGVFSLEMTQDMLALRMLCSRARVNIRNVRDGFMAERDFPRITHAAGKLARTNLYIDDTSPMSITELQSKGRKMVSQWGVRLIIVDYLQLIHAVNAKKENDTARISEVSAGLKELAKQTKRPVIAISQLSRDSEREKRRPRLSDLRSSGSVEQDADQVWLLSRQPKSDDDVDQDTDTVTCDVAKNRNGPTGLVHLTFLKAYTRFESAAKITEGDVPELL